MAQLSVEPNDRVTFKVHLEDEHLAVVDKRSGLVTQPGVGHERDTLLNGLFARWGTRLQNLGAARDFGLLHRLDAETSGVLIVAFTTGAYTELRRQFEAREVRKFYYAIVARAPKVASDVIRLPMAEETRRTSRYSAVTRGKVTRSGKPAVTAFRVLSAGDRGALVECRPVTGRLHQVRIHMEAIGCPVLGDRLYGKADGLAPRLALHAHRVIFKHPATGETVEVRSPLPKELRAVLTRLGLELPRATPSGAAPHEEGESSRPPEITPEGEVDHRPGEVPELDGA